ncbi:MAG: hypothetical protein WCD30_15285 [Pseudolabrys sp.]
MLALLMPTAALAQQTTLYGPDGKVTGRATARVERRPLSSLLMSLTTRRAQGG